MAITRLPPPPFSNRQLQYAVAVAETHSFRQAAQLCGVSQPSLSAQLAQLEDALGVRLFERDRRRVLTTAAGEALVGRARRILAETDDLIGAARRLGDPLTGTLRIGVIPTISPYLLPTVVRALRRAHERLVVRWIEDKTDVLVRELEDGGLDAALLALEAELGDLARESIARDRFMLAVPSGHPLGKSRRAASARELDGAPVLLLDDGHCLRNQALAVCSGTGAEELGFRATSLPTLAQMVASGAGVTLLPEMAVATEAKRAALTVRPLADAAAFRTVGLVWRASSPLGPALRTLAGTIRDAYPSVTTRPSPKAARWRT